MDFYAGDNPIGYLNQREHARLRPGMYIGGTDSRALHRLIEEVLYHMASEADSGQCDTIRIDLHPEGQITLEDNGRGLPVVPFRDTPFTQMEVMLQGIGVFRRDFESSDYVDVGGMMGVGLPVVNALCADMQVENYRDGCLWVQSYQAGKPASPLTKISLEHSARTGTRFTLSPDPTIFQTTYFDYENLMKRAQELAYLLPGVTFAVRDLRSQPRRVSMLQYPNGLKALVSDSVGDNMPLHMPLYGKSRILVNQERTPPLSAAIEIAVMFSRSEKAQLVSYVNLVPATDGTHVAAAKSALVKCLNQYLTGETGGKVERWLRWKDVAAGITLAIAILHPDPMYLSATKMILGNREVRAPIRRLIRDMVREQLPPDIAQQYLEYCLSRKHGKGQYSIG